MRKSNFFSSLCFLLSLTLITACSAGGGYNKRSWDYSQRSQPTAQEAPKPLSQSAVAEDITAENTTGDTPTPAKLPQADSMKTVKVGLLLPLSGKHSALGEAMLNAAQIALFDIGHNSFELIPHDTQGTASGARSAAKSAVQDGVELVLGPVFADAVRAAKPITNSARINMVAFSTDWTLAGGNTFIMGFLPFDQVDRITSYAASQNINKIGVVSPTTDYGQIVTTSYQSAAAKYGLQTPAIERFNPGSNNLSPNVRRLAKYDERMQAMATAKAAAQQNPAFVQPPPEKPFEAVLMPVGGQTAISIGNLLSQYDLPPREVRRLGTGLLDDASLRGESSLEGAWFAAPSPQLRHDFENRYIETYRTGPPRLASLAYDATALAAVLAQRGIKSSGKPAFDRNSIGNPNGFSGIDGIFRFRPNGTAERGLAVLEFRRGKIVVVDEAPKTFQKPVQQY